MRVPKTQRIYCPHCRKHQEHTLEQAKKKQRRKKSMGQRRYLKILKGYGSFPRPKPSHEKPTRKQDLRYKCKVCNKKHMKGQGFRVKKFEIIKNK